MNTDTQPHLEQPYLDLLRLILERGSSGKNRTAFSARKIFGHQMRFDLTRGFPLLTTKLLSWRNIVTELLWFLRGETNVASLLKAKNSIWSDWPCRRWLQETDQPVPDQRTDNASWKAAVADFNRHVLSDPRFAQTYGNCGPIYGFQWRHWPDGNGGEIDQITRLIAEIKKNPNGRRHIVSAWNVADIEEMDVSGLPPCHCLFQFDVDDGRLSCQLYQRSCDTFLGVPYNIASYALLTCMIAQVCDLTPHEFIWTGGNVHIYENHVEQVNEQLSRVPNQAPRLALNPGVRDIFAFEEEHIGLMGYNPHPAIRGDIAV
jgi:thymidylate synthase